MRQSPIKINSHDDNNIISLLLSGNPVSGHFDLLITKSKAWEEDDQEVGITDSKNDGKCNKCGVSFKSNAKLLNHVNKKLCDSAKSANPPKYNDASSINQLSQYFGIDLQTSENEAPSLWPARWEKIITLKRLQYNLPNGSIGDKFVQLLTEEILMLANGVETSERVICFIAVMLQREKMVKKTKDIRRLIDRRLTEWKEERFDELINEALRCDKSLKNKWTKLDENDFKQLKETSFNRLVQRGKIKEASRLINQNMVGGVLSPDDKIDSNTTVYDLLKEKHPEPVIPNKEFLKLPETMTDVPYLENGEITAEHVEKVARKLHGSGGPGGSSSENWTDFLLRHGKKSALLRSAVATLALKLNGEIVPWFKIKALMANRLVAIDKCPGIRPIGIGECLRRIIAKCIIIAFGEDAKHALGTDQLCGGLKAGIEGAIHCMQALFEEKCSNNNNWCMILVDADNAFNKINRVNALWQARLHWPRAARFIFNSYQNSADLVIPGSNKRLYSQEGVTQGDPLSMILYGLATLPLIKELKTMQNVFQAWYADDSSCQGRINDVVNWWEKLKDIGPRYGYYPQAKKTKLIWNYHHAIPKSTLQKLEDIEIVKGSKFLGGFVGCEQDKKIYATEKINNWTQHVENLAEIAKKHPQSANTVATKSLQSEWTFFQRVVEVESEMFCPIQTAIRTSLFPNLFGSQVNLTDSEHEILHLSVKNGGIGIADPVAQSKNIFKTSKRGCEVLTSALKLTTPFDFNDHEDILRSSLKTYREEKKTEERKLLNKNLKTFSTQRQNTILRNADPKSSHGSWLSCIPLKKLNLDMSPQEFRDSLALRYGKTPSQLPSKCEGCGNDFTVEHALKCPIGGLIIKRHNEIRDALGSLMEQAWGNCVIEPLVAENGNLEAPALKADLACRGVWETQMEALFDVRVVDTDAPSYVSQPHYKVLQKAEEDKKRKYMSSCETRNASFTPLVTTVNGILGDEFQALVRALAERLSEKWGKPYSIIVNWVRVRITCSILRATSMCIRRSRKKWRSAREFEDGAGIRYLY